MNAGSHGLGNAESNVSSLVPRVALADGQNAGLVLEEPADGFGTERPQLSKLWRGIIVFRM